MKKLLFFCIFLFFISFGYSENKLLRYEWELSFVCERNDDETLLEEISSEKGRLYAKNCKSYSIPNANVQFPYNAGQSGGYFIIRRDGNDYIFEKFVHPDKKYELYRLNIIYDSTPPVIDAALYLDINCNQKIDVNKWYNTNVVYVKVNSFEDSISGVKKLSLNYSLDQSVINNVQDGTDNIITITGKDNVGNQGVKTLQIKIDNQVPEIQFTSDKGIQINSKEDSWTQEKTICFKDKNQNEKSSQTSFYINSISASNKITSPYYFETGKYTIHAKDEAENEISCQLNVDHTPPNIECENLIYSYAENTKMVNSINFEVSYNDNDEKNSGFEEGYVPELYYDDNNNTDSSISDRTQTNILKLQGTVTDKAGNSNTIDWEKSVFAEKGTVGENNNLVLVLPPYVNPEPIIAESDGVFSKVKLKLLNCNDDFINKTNWVKIKRNFYVPNDSEYIKITDENFTEYFDESLKNIWESLSVSPEIDKNNIQKENEEYIYIDSIPVESGFGHMRVGYSLVWETKDLPTIEESEEDFIEPAADTQAKINLRLKGFENKYLNIVIENNKITYIENKDFSVPANGCVKLEYKIENSDIEPYELEVREIVSIPGTEEFISVGKDGFVHRGAMQGCNTYTYENEKEVFSQNNWHSFEEPIHLYFNTPTNLILSTKEGYLYKRNNGTVFGQNEYTSPIIQLKAEPKDLGGFNLIVGDLAGYNDQGITAKPFQPVDMEISTDKESDILWDFGDNNTITGKRITHIWVQSESRLSDTSEYTMKINLEGTDTEIPVHIVDTQYGKLYGNEVWRGNHIILSNISVNEGKILTIGDETNLKADILCLGDLTDENKAGLFISNDSTLLLDIASNIRFIESRNNKTGYISQEQMVYGWKGISIKGIASIENIDFFYADRAITLMGGGKLNLKNCNFDQNKIGLHFLSKEFTTVSNCKILNSYEYGIKQEVGSEIEVVSSEISGNTINWYDYDDTELTEEEINNRIGK